MVYALYDTVEISGYTHGHSDIKLNATGCNRLLVEWRFDPFFSDKETIS